jgi:hypothetical protein
MKRNDWQARYGVKRREIDKALLKECERSLPPIAPAPPYTNDEMHVRIARAFGRLN